MLPSNLKETVEHGWLKEQCTKSNKNALVADLQSNRPYIPFKEESKQTIHTLGNVDCFGLCEISPKVQGPYCLKHWTEGVVYWTCGACLVRTELLDKERIRRIDNLQLRDQKKVHDMVLVTINPRHNELVRDNVNDAQNAFTCDDMNHGVRGHVLTRKCIVHFSGSVFCVHRPSRSVSCVWLDAKTQEI